MDAPGRRRRTRRYAMLAIGAAVVILVLATPQLLGIFGPTRQGPSVGPTSTSSRLSFENSTIEAFVKVPALYASLGYPSVDYAGFPASNYSSMECAGFTPPPTIALERAVSLAVSQLGLDPANYSLAAARFDPGAVTSCSHVVDPRWSLGFARTFAGFWIYGPFGPGGPQPLALIIDAVNGSFLSHSQDFSSLPISGSYELKVGSSSAVAAVRASGINVTVPGRAFQLAKLGNATSEQPRITLLGPTAPNAPFDAPLNASLSGQKRLCWIITLTGSDESYTYTGTFAVDAADGELMAYMANGAAKSSVS